MYLLKAALLGYALWGTSGWFWS